MLTAPDARDGQARAERAFRILRAASTKIVRDRKSNSMCCLQTSRSVIGVTLLTTGDDMDLTPRELDKLIVYQVAELARRRRERGTPLNISEAQALVSEAILEAARDGKSVAECMEIGKGVVSVSDCLPGVRERVTLLQIEATFPDGSKLISCHDPIGG